MRVTMIIDLDIETDDFEEAFEIMSELHAHVELAPDDDRVTQREISILEQDERVEITKDEV